MKNYFKYAISNEFISNVLKITSSTMISGFIVAITLPIITKIFTASELGKYQLIVSIITSLGVISALKYEMAIVLPKNDAIAKIVYKICFYVLIVFCLLVYILFFFADSIIFNYLNAENILNFSKLIPIGVFFFGALEIIKSSLVRGKKFSSFSLAKVYQIASTQILIIVIGLINASTISLFIAFISGIIISSIIFVKKSIIEVKSDISSSLLDIALKYKKFPLVNTFMVFSNTISNELPVFFIMKYHSSEILGFYMLANRLLVIPMNVIGTSIGKVYFQRASEVLNNDLPGLFKLYKKTTLRLIKIGTLPFICIIIFSSIFIKFIFGHNWETSSVIMQIMSFGMFFKFITSPISTTFTILNKQEISFYITIFALLFRFSTMLYFHESLILMLYALSASSAVYYLIYHIFVYRLLMKVSKNNK
tara:strand:- start:744 stop:2012 length:1269 start_codon:yes stop_codon:yes gene_type:complete